MPSLEVAGQPYPDRLREQLRSECRAWNVSRMPSDRQIGAVLHAMADLTSIMAMTSYDRLEHFPGSENEGKELKSWPTETSIGRFFHAAGDAFGSRFYKE